MGGCKLCTSLCMMSPTLYFLILFDVPSRSMPCTSFCMLSQTGKCSLPPVWCIHQSNTLYLFLYDFPNVIFTLSIWYSKQTNVLYLLLHDVPNWSLLFAYFYIMSPMGRCPVPQACVGCVTVKKQYKYQNKYICWFWFHCNKNRSKISKFSHYTHIFGKKSHLYWNNHFWIKT